MFDLGRLALKTKLEGDLYFFARYAFLQSTGNRWSRNWHHQRICDALMRVYRGECMRLIINIPPRYSKTELAVVNFIAWCLAKQPDCEFIHSSYSARLAANNTSRVRDLVSSEWFQNLFDTRLDPNTSAKDHWTTSDSGVVYAAGAGGTITGFGAGKLRPGFGGAIILDDPHKADEANSTTMRQNVINWYGNTIKSRVNSPDTPIIVIMQRLHESDLCGWLLQGGSGELWEHLCIPVLDVDDQPLWPSKHDREALRQMETSGSYVFAGQYMQRPAPLGGGIFKDSWWRYYDPKALPKVKRLVHSWDTAFKTADHNDPSSGTVWAECEHGYYLLDRINERLEYPGLKRRVRQLNDKWKATAILVEDKASGQSLIQDLKTPEPGKVRLPVIPVKVDTDKVTRAFAVTPLVESGQVFLPEGEPWVLDYVAQLGQFPNAAHDDDVDSTTQALNWLSHGKSTTGLIDYYKQVAEAQQVERERKSA